jgi:hypothetical protein
MTRSHPLGRQAGDAIPRAMRKVAVPPRGTHHQPARPVWAASAAPGSRLRRCSNLQPRARKRGRPLTAGRGGGVLGKPKPPAKRAQPCVFEVDDPALPNLETDPSALTVFSDNAAIDRLLDIGRCAKSARVDLKAALNRPLQHNGAPLLRAAGRRGSVRPTPPCGNPPAASSQARTTGPDFRQTECRA